MRELTGAERASTGLTTTLPLSDPPYPRLTFLKLGYSPVGLLRSASFLVGHAESKLISVKSLVKTKGRGRRVDIRVTSHGLSRKNKSGRSTGVESEQRRVHSTETRRAHTRSVCSHYCTVGLLGSGYLGTARHECEGRGRTLQTQRPLPSARARAIAAGNACVTASPVPPRSPLRPPQYPAAQHSARRTI